MTATTAKARFMANNFLGADIPLTATSEATGFPVENVYHSVRSKVWRGAGHFEITASNGTFYFNDGSARTAVVPPGGYTIATLATAIAAAAVAAGASATVVASAYSTAPYIWQLVFNSSVTLTLSSTTNAIWDVLGFTGSTDRTGTTFRADAARAHTHEIVQAHFGAPMTPTFFAAIGAIDEACPASENAVWTLMFNNIPSWSAPPVSVTLERSDAGFFAFLDSLATTTYEYAALKIVDRENVLGTAGAQVGHLYIGDHTTLTSSNIGIGFTKSFVDRSEVQRSLDGTRYSNLRPKYRSFRGFGVGLIDAAERRELEQLFFDLGVGESFYLSIDPALEVSESLEEMTFYACIPSEPTIRHEIRDRYSIDFDVEEAV
jgi:hypothetical protein